MRRKQGQAPEMDHIPAVEVAKDPSAQISELPSAIRGRSGGQEFDGEESRHGG